MEPSDAVAADLAALTDALGEPDADVTTLIRRLNDSCAQAVASYLGFCLTLIIDDVAVTFTLLEDFLDPAEILTSLRFPLTALGHSVSYREVILYAGNPGAFVDLAADLTYTLGAVPDAVQLDQHLTPPDPTDGDSGLAALSRHHQALGILIDHGLDLDEGRTELRRRARQAGTSVDAAAQQLIDASMRPPPA